MSGQWDVPPEVHKVLPGALGSLVALRWIAGTPIQRFTSFFGGGAGAYYGTPYMQSTMGTDSGLTGFLLGLFGMALVSKLFDAIAVMNFGERIERLLTKWGL